MSNDDYARLVSSAATTIAADRRPNRRELEKLLPPDIRMEPNICITVCEIRSGEHYSVSQP